MGGEGPFIHYQGGIPALPADPPSGHAFRGTCPRGDSGSSWEGRGSRSTLALSSASNQEDPPRLVRWADNTLVLLQSASPESPLAREMPDVCSELEAEMGIELGSQMHFKGALFAMPGTSSQGGPSRSLYTVQVRLFNRPIASPEVGPRENAAHRALRRRAAGCPAPGAGFVQSQRRSPTPVRHQLRGNGGEAGAFKLGALGSHGPGRKGCR